jgi:hypothetical protein
MADGLQERDEPRAATLPGSAQLPAALARVRHHAWLSQSGRLARPASGRLVAISSSTVLLVVGVALALVLTSGTTPTGGPSGDSTSQLASVLDFGRSPLSLPTDQRSRTASAATGVRHGGQQPTSGSRGHDTARVSRKRRRLGSRASKIQSAARERALSQSASGQAATTVTEPSSPQPVSTSPSYGNVSGGRGTRVSSATGTSASDSSGSASLPAGPTGIGSAGGCNPKCS